MEGRIRAFGFAFEPLSSKILKPKSIPSKIKDNKLAEEIWQRRRKNKTTYFATNNSQVTGLLKQKETNVGRNRKYTQKAEILQPVGKNFGISNRPGYYSRQYGNYVLLLPRRCPDHIVTD